jgi:hypothetical protein
VLWSCSTALVPWLLGRRDEGTKGRRDGKIMLTIEDRCRGLCESLEGFDMFRYVSIIRDALRQINGSKNSRCALQLQRHPRIQYTHVYTQWTKIIIWATAYICARACT